MSVSGIGSYQDALYKWQGQQLKNTASSNAASSSGNALSSLFGNTASITSQISSLVELTKYAMDKMGVGSDSRVTFSQITKYREKLQSEFNEEVKKGFAESGISDLSALSFSLDADGKITALGSSASDRKKAQAWLDSNPDFGKTIRESLAKDGVETSETIEFRLSGSGKMILQDNASEALRQALENAKIDDDLHAGLKNAGIDLTSAVELSFDHTGALVANGDPERAAAIDKWLKDNPGLEERIKEILEKQDASFSATTIRLDGDGVLQATTSSDATEKIREALGKLTDTGAKIVNGLESLAIDPDISFSLQINDDGTLNIISDHADKDKVEQFFAENPELLKKYQQIETLAGIDDARKAMQISPSAMRKRIQIESMAAWWAESGNSGSYFGTYNDGGLSMLSGVNLKI